MFKKRKVRTERVKKLLAGVTDLYELKGADGEKRPMSNGELARWTQKERVREEVGKQTAMQEDRAALLLATARADAVARLEAMAAGGDKEQSMRACAILLRGRVARDRRRRGKAEEGKEGQTKEPSEYEMQAAREKWEEELRAEG